jgi:hypothetical protein
MILYLNNTARVKLRSASNSWEPVNDGGQGLGRSGQRWSEVWASNGTIQTSDEREKTQVVDCDLGLDFIKALRPKRWVWADIDRPAKHQRRTIRRPKTRLETVKRVVEELIDGKLVQREVETQETLPVQIELQVYDHKGDPVVVMEPLYDSDGNKVGENVTPVTRVVQEYEEIEIDEVIEAPLRVQHRRPHYGLSAQQVKAAMEDLAIADFAGYIYDRETDRYALRYHEFTAPMIVAIQQLADRLAALETARKLG